MRSLITLTAVCALLISAAAAQQYPAQDQQYPQQQYPQQQYPQQQYPQQDQYPQQQNSQYPQYPNNGGYYGAPSIPAGTQLKIRTNENIVADAQSAGRTYAAEIADDVMGPNRQVIIPRGSPAQLTVQ